MWKKPTNNMESYHRPFTLITLAPFTIPIRKAVDGSLKDQNVRIRRSGFLI